LWYVACTIGYFLPVIAFTQLVIPSHTMCIYVLAIAKMAANKMVLYYNIAIAVEFDNIAGQETNP